jgi:hypothetical protein
MTEGHFHYKTRVAYENSQHRKQPSSGTEPFDNFKNFVKGNQRQITKMV